MKNVSIYLLLLPLFVSSRDTLESCLTKDSGEFSITLNNVCSPAAFKDAIDKMLANKSGCHRKVNVEIRRLFDYEEESSEDENQEIRELCNSMYETVDEKDFIEEVFEKTSSPLTREQDYANFFYGLTDLNTKPSPDISFVNSVASHKDSRYSFPPPGGRSFDQCDSNAVMCCWVQKSDGNEIDGNTDVCYVNNKRAKYSNEVNGGLILYPGESEGPVKCAGYVFGEEENTPQAYHYRGNMLFNIAFDLGVKSGYVRNVPGAPMCGCADEMPVVDFAQCYEPDVTETFTFNFKSEGGFAGESYARKGEIGYKKCADADNLADYYATLAGNGMASKKGKKVFDQTVLSTDCDEATDTILRTRGFRLLD